jgi:predicted glycogen debranching enzyme
MFAKNILCIDLDYRGELIFTLDVRDIYDFDDKGRIYSQKKNDNIIIEYKKFKDNMLEDVSFSKFLAFKTSSKSEPIDKWREESYEEDEARNSNPSRLYVYDAFKLICRGKDTIKISFGDDEAEAVNGLSEETLDVKPNYGKETRKLNNAEETIAYNLSLDSIYDLNVKNKGLYAGLPWFFQVWTRDAAVSLKALTDAKDFDFCRLMLMDMIKHVSQDGKIPNRFPMSTLSTADGTGWVFLRLHELMLETEKTKMMEEYFSKKNVEFIREQVNISIERHRPERFLIKNGALETWMDTSYGNDTREGFRIEIQALWLEMLNFSNYLDRLTGRKESHKETEEKTKLKVLESFFKGDILKDGTNDETIRPNIFLACYIYPELLTKPEWERVFDLALERLWLEWGGLSTIDKSSKLFCQNYTGEDNRSYHRGDSWFFINNIAAICMLRLNKKKYAQKIEKITTASTSDILWKGILGRASEISSASVQKAEGSLFQLWSCATYVEMQNVKNP